MKPLKIRKGTPKYLNANENPTYDEWIKRIDSILVHYRGISLYDLADCPTREWYDKRIRPSRAANMALKYSEGF
jgi:hypothetical protein